MAKISLVTGATGFIGANLVRKLLSENHEVHVIVRKDTKNLWRVNEVKKKIHIHNGDILNYSELEEIISKTKPNYVFHLAAYGA